MRRVCYDETNSYLVIQLGSLYLHYCKVEPYQVNSLLHSEAVGRPRRKFTQVASNPERDVPRYG